MKNITVEFIKSLNPCKVGIDDFESKYPKYNAPLSKLLYLDDISYADKIWLVTNVVGIKVLQQWSIDCAEFVVDNYNDAYPSDTSVSECIEVTKKYLLGQCTVEDVRSAAESAWSARSAAESAAESAWSARSAAESARSAAWSAAESAWSARSARSAAESVARSAAESARSAAWSARSAAESAEKDQETINLSLLIALL